MAATVERKRPWLFEGYREEEGTTIVTLTLPKRLAWALGIYSRGQGVDLGVLCFAALNAIVKAKRIPWSWFDEIVASRKPDPQKTEVQAPGGNPVDSADDPVVTVEQPPAPPATPESGGGEGRRKDPARTQAAIARRKAG